MSDNGSNEEKILNEDQGAGEEPNSSSEESESSEEGTCLYCYSLSRQDLQFISMERYKTVDGP